MRSTEYRVLLLDDDDERTRSLLRMLRLPPCPELSVQHAPTLSQGETALGDGEFDVLLLGDQFVLGDSRHDRTDVKTFADRLPVVTMMGSADTDAAARLFEFGVHDCIVVDERNHELIAHSIQNALDTARCTRKLERVSVERDALRGELEAIRKSLSHDVRSPLAIIEMSLNAIRKCESGVLDEYRNHAQIALENTKQLWHQVDALLEKTKGCAGAHHGENVDAEWVDCNKVLQRVLGQRTAKSPNAEPRVTWDDLPAIWTVPEQMERLFENLIQMAPEVGRDIIELRFSADFYNPDWVFTASYERPVRADAPGTSTGLSQEDSKRLAENLDYCRDLIEPNGGRFWVDTETATSVTLFFYIRHPGKPGVG